MFEQDVPPRSTGQTCCLARALLSVAPLFGRLLTKFYFRRSIELPLSACTIRKM